VPDTGPRDPDHLYTPEAAEMLAILRHQIEIAQGRAPADAEAAR
jgi:NitT/TauT family transport system ATP-binding protein